MAKLVDIVNSGGPIVRGDKRIEAVRQVQILLGQAGHILERDGDFGPATETAVKTFQGARSIKASGRVGTDTAAALDELVPEIGKPEPSLGSVKSGAPWLMHMRAFTGKKEVPGAADSPFILGMADEIGKRFPDLAAYCRQYTHDSIPWCGLCVAYVTALADIKPVTKADGAEFGFLWADDWKHFGAKLTRPVVGSILVLTRNGGGHVTIMEGETSTHYIGRGGNQSDMIKVSSFPKDRLTAAVWPNGYATAQNLPGITSGSTASISER